MIRNVHLQIGLLWWMFHGDAREIRGQTLGCFVCLCSFGAGAMLEVSAFLQKNLIGRRAQKMDGGANLPTGGNSSHADTVTDRSESWTVSSQGALDFDERASSPGAWMMMDTGCK